VRLAAFHGAESARDRERLRESVLRGKGWTILRVWSTDWFANADLQTDRLVSELQRLAARPVQSQSQWTILSEGAVPPIVIAERSSAPKDEGPSLTAALELSMSPQPLDDARLSEIEVKNRLRAFRDSEIVRDFPQLDPERCILREIMINKIVESRLDEPSDFTRKVPPWLRERTDQKQIKYLENLLDCRMSVIIATFARKAVGKLEFPRRISLAVST
jgi:hypothetical protein